MKGKRTLKEPKLLVARHVKLISDAKAKTDEPHPCLRCDRCELQFWPGTHVATLALKKFEAFIKDHERCEFR